MKAKDVTTTTTTTKDCFICGGGCFPMQWCRDVTIMMYRSKYNQFLFTKNGIQYIMEFFKLLFWLKEQAKLAAAMAIA